VLYETDTAEINARSYPDEPTELDLVAPEFETMIGTPATQQVSVSQVDVEIDSMSATIHSMALPVAANNHNRTELISLPNMNGTMQQSITKEKKKRTSSPKGTFNTSGTPSLTTFKRM